MGCGDANTQWANMATGTAWGASAGTDGGLDQAEIVRLLLEDTVHVETTSHAVSLIFVVLEFLIVGFELAYIVLCRFSSFQ